MAALEIQCFLDEAQMDALTGYVSDKLFRTQKDDVEDIDACFDTMSVRLCVEFAVGLENVGIRQAEILDSDWNVIDADSAVLRSRLNEIIDAYNYSDNQLKQQQADYA